MANERYGRIGKKMKNRNHLGKNKNNTNQNKEQQKET